MTRADGEHDVYTACKSKIFAFVTRPRSPSVTTELCVVYECCITLSLSALVVRYCWFKNCERGFERTHLFMDLSCVHKLLLTLIAL